MQGEEGYDPSGCAVLRGGEAAAEGVEGILKHGPEGPWCNLRARGQEEGKAGSPSDFPT